MKEVGKVVKILGDNKVEVELSATGGCKKCGLCRIGLNNKAYMTAGTRENLAIGDYVEVEMKEREVVFVTFLVFILPLILFFLGYLIYNYILAIISLVGYFIGLWFYDRNAQKKGKYLPFVVRKS